MLLFPGSKLSKVPTETAAGVLNMISMFYAVVGVAMIIVGSMHMNTYPAPYSMVPIYLIVQGAWGLAVLMLTPLFYKAYKYRECFATTCVVSVSLFFFAWHLVGSVYVYSSYNMAEVSELTDNILVNGTITAPATFFAIFHVSAVWFLLAFAFIGTIFYGCEMMLSKI